MAEAFAPHSDGTFPKELIESRRPNEPAEVQAYRKKVWKPKTKPTFGRIISSLGKIRRSSDWSISYPKTEFSRISEGETLQDYCEDNFPKFRSVTNWVFSLLLKKDLVDPNAICLIVPMKFDVEETEFVKPFPYLFDSVDVIDHVDDDYVLLKYPAGAVYYTEKGQIRYGKSFIYADGFVIEKWNQVNVKGDMRQEYEYAHGLPEVPFFKLGAVTIEASETDYLFASRIEDILPELDEAIREYSDLQAGIVLHAYPERWEFTSAECPACNHTGLRPNPLSTDDNPLDPVDCNYPGCNHGYITTGPYSKIQVRPTDMGINQQSSPIPPAGYIEKDIAILTFMQNSISKHIFDGLSAINFQFLEQSPQAQSGVAKEVDKDELNNTVNAIAEDIVRIMDSVYRIIAFYRYFTQYGEETVEMLPTISVPERFDILSVNYLSEELDKAKKSGFNPAILNALEVEYSSKKFNADPEVSDFLGLILSLDPLSNITEDEKISRLSNKGITQKSYVISSNIQAFVQRALQEDEGFATAEYSEQVKKMETYADELIKGMDTATVITTDVMDEETDPSAEL